MNDLTLNVVALSGAVERAARASGSWRPSADSINRGLQILGEAKSTVIRVPRELWRKLTPSHLAVVNGRTVAFESSERGLHLALNGDLHLCECGNMIEPDGLWEINARWIDDEHFECGQCADRFKIEYRCARDVEDVVGDQPSPFIPPVRG